MKSNTKAFSGVIDRVRTSVASDPDRRAFTFLDFPTRSGPRKECTHTIGEIDAKARAIAALLREASVPGARAILLFRPGADFVAAFLGCLYAGVIAVPLPMLRHGLGADRVNAIVRDCGASIALATASTMNSAREHVANAGDLSWLLVDRMEAPMASGWTPASPGRDDIALLQYSSGSTGAPKGVMISHGNLIHQAELLYGEVGAKPMECWVAWLPIFHDMGLISGIVTPLAKELHSVLMAPEAFVLRPVRWLQAMSDFKATCCASPNFAYELCARKISEDDLDGIDLSSLRFAVSGAEPIRATTIERFSERFARCCFRAEAFYPAYGLAEATLLVTGGRRTAATGTFDIGKLDEGIATPMPAGVAATITLVSSGTPQGGNEIRIVDPQAHTEMPASQVGEIWVAGEGVGVGYWGADAALDSAFCARLAHGSEQSFLRTGDLGFVHEGELYVRGRLKDLIIIRGVNHCAPDIEHTVEAVDGSLSPSSSAAFSIDVGDDERLVIVSELERHSEGLTDERLASIASTIRQRVSERHQVSPYAIVLLANGLPKTSSGKVQRHACRSRYLAGEFTPRLAWTDGSLADAATGVVDTYVDAIDADEHAMRRRLECELWLIRQFTALSPASGENIGIATPLTSLALDEAGITATVQAIKLNFGLAIPYTVFAECETIDALAGYLADAAEANSADGGAQVGLPAEALDFSLERPLPVALDMPVAVVGIACRFPSADGPREFWHNICAGMDAVGDIPAERWNGDALYDENPLALGKMNTRRGGFLKDAENFDARFFGIQTREATRMDPAHRILLELSWEVFEDAGILAASVSGASVGVYVGISGSDYAQLQFGDEALSDPYAGIGCALTNAASRISHFHNLRGPAMAIDTACSSSLSAMHLGCTAIRTGECDMALAGGVNIILSPTVSMSLSKAGMMAPDGRCKTFDKGADGYVRSEGAGLVLLKPLAKALEDGDEIYAVVRGSATNQDGRSSAISAPNGEAQQRVVLAACEHAGIQPGMLDYVEAHGTGTALGDPIEVNALGEVLKLGAEPGTICAIGSVKTNIGHCESAAGVASFIKAAMILDSDLIPPSLNFQEPNPLIHFENYRVAVQTKLTALPSRPRLRLAGVNSFGIGGTNVHFVLEEMKRDEQRKTTSAASEQELHVVPLSAKSEKSLKAMAKAMAEFLFANEVDVCMADVCHTLAQRRTQLDHRLSVVGANAAEIASNLDAYLISNYHTDAFYGHRAAAIEEQPSVAFVFSGHGSQWWAMGRQLYETEAVYRAEIERCDSQLKIHTGWSVINVLMASAEESRLGETAYLQPAVFALQVAMVALLRSFGVSPDAVIGHSFGEVAAAHVSGALTLADACHLIAVRARLMQETKGNGRMASIELSRAEIEAELEAHGQDLSIAVSNGPSTTVVSGKIDALDILVTRLRARGVGVLELGLDHAFHSDLVEDARLALSKEIASIRPVPPVIPYMSTVTASWCEGTRLLDHHYWGDNIRKEVRFREAVEAMALQGTRIFVEIGAYPILLGGVGRILKAINVKGTTVPTLQKNVDDRRAVLQAVANLHSLGKSVDWASLNHGGRMLRGLPQYRWDRQRFWMDAPHLEARTRVSTHPLVSARMPVAQPTWQSRVDSQSHPFLSALRVRGESRLANGLFLELALDAGNDGVVTQAPRELCDLTFSLVERLDSEGIPAIQTSVQQHADGRRMARVATQTDDSKGRSKNWHDALACQFIADAEVERRPARMDIELLKARYTQKYSGADIYRKLGEVGVEYAGAAHIASDLWFDDSSALVDLRLADSVRIDADRYHVHPLVFEAMEQAGRFAAGSSAAQARLRHVRRLRLLGATSQAAYAYASLVDAGDFAGTIDADDVAHANLWLLDAAGEVLAVAEGVSYCADSAQVDDEYSIPSDIERWRYRVNWRSAPLEAIEQGGHAQAGRWLVLADDGGLGEEVCRWLESKDQQCVCVRKGAAYAHQRANEFCVSTASSEDLPRLLKEAFVDEDVPCKGVVHLWSLDATRVANVSKQTLADDCASGVLSVTDVVRALSSTELQRPPRLWIVTRCAQSVGSAERSIELSQALVWGCAKSIVLEHAELRCCRIDLDEGTTGDQAGQLCDELWADRIDDQIAFRDGERYIAQLDYALSADAANDEDAGAYRIAIVAGEPLTLERRRARRQSPDAGKVEIRIEAASVATINAGAASGDVLAQQCVGSILRVASDIVDVHVGQRVMVLEAGILGSHRVAPASSLVPIPSALSAQDAVASARSHFSALFALRELAGVKRGSRVLVRLGANRNGLAALRVAKWLGAKVYVEAAAHLHEDVRRLKVALVFDESEPLAYLEAKALTRDEGVEVLINYASDLDASVCACFLRSFGRCIEMTPADAGRGMGLLRSSLAGNVSLLSIDVDALLRERQVQSRALLAETLERMADGAFKGEGAALHPLASLQDLIASDSAGEILVALPQTQAREVTAHKVAYRSDSTYVISGGLGGLGLNIAKRMVRDGARHIVLLARRAPSLDAMDVIAELTETGARCLPMSVDVADEASLRAALDHVRRDMPPIRGIVHAAGILDNGLIVQMTHAQVRAVMPAKVDGAWNLHVLTDADELEFFVMFSSLASFIGSPGQSNYAAANAFLEALAEHRSRKDKPGLSIAWGPWAEAGMAADVHNLQRLAQHGMGMIPLEDGMNLLEDLIVERQSGAVGALPMNWAAWGRTRGYAAQTPYFSGLVPQQALVRNSYGKITAESLAACSADAQLDQLQHAVLRAVCQSMLLDAESVELDIPLTALGLDSIIALELKDRIESGIEVVVRTNALIAGKSIRALAQQFREEMVAAQAQPALPGKASAQVEADPIDSAAVLETLDELTPEQIETLIRQLTVAEGEQVEAVPDLHK